MMVREFRYPNSSSHSAPCQWHQLQDGPLKIIHAITITPISRVILSQANPNYPFISGQLIGAPWCLGPTLQGIFIPRNDSLVAHPRNCAQTMSGTFSLLEPREHQRRGNLKTIKQQGNTKTSFHLRRVSNSYDMPLYWLTDRTSYNSLFRIYIELPTLKQNSQGFA